MISIYTDGGSRNNPGEAAFGFVIYDNEKEVVGIGKRLGITTNNVAEYTAVIESFAYLLSHRELLGDFSGIQVYLDSSLICNQMQGKFKVKHPNMIPLFSKAKELEKDLSLKVTYTYIPREKNKRADQLVNMALDNLL